MPKTSDPEIVRKWAEERGGKPAKVKGTQNLLRISFGLSARNLEEIDWEEFIKAFKDLGLVFLYVGSKDSRFCKFLRA